MVHIYFVAIYVVFYLLNLDFIRLWIPTLATCEWKGYKMNPLKPKEWPTSIFSL